jgi:EAL domain-containing protein (putative c-di-GMP-specific phosphodiesterase class I)/FixJ family two-component response regulator
MEPSNYIDSVLVVDDEPFVLRTTVAILHRMGFTHVVSAESVTAAIDAVSSTDPPVKLVLSDLNMPDADGLELLRRFDEMKFDGDIVLFSGEDSQTLNMAETLAKARGLSVIGAIEKPVQTDLFLDILSRHTPATRHQNGPSEKPRITPEMLEAAIEAGELKPWFQPKIQISDLQPVGVEVLARWPDSSLGPIYPDAFIPVAETHGLIDKLTFSLAKQAAAMECSWRREGVNLKVALNISMDSLHQDQFTETLEQVVTTAGGALDSILLEVTESQLMKDILLPLEALLRLRMKKVKLSIDDFGTGHSNISQLRDLPFDELKLDRSYVQSGKNIERNGIILESTVEMAKKLGMSIVAEGVENIEEWQRVEMLGCDQIQGYFTARPMPGEEIVDWVNLWPEKRKTLFPD